MDLKHIPVSEFRRIESSVGDLDQRLELLADMNRANTLAAVKRAGSGHLGSSLSSLDMVTYLYYHAMNIRKVGVESCERDIYFSSKGHDVPGWYSVAYSLGWLSKEQFWRLRRLGGTCGHPDVGTLGVEANSGSLGMGIGKAKGMAWAKRHLKQGGRVFVMLGDGELQEGQIFESLQAAVHQQIDNVHVLIDHNKVQSDRPVTEIGCLGDLEQKFRSFGWDVSRCNGHSFQELGNVFRHWESLTGAPKVMIADTIKGRGVSFMEHPAALKANGGVYRWHAGAPDDPSFGAAFKEIVDRLDGRLQELGIPSLQLEPAPPDDRSPSSVTKEFVADAYGESLAELAAKHDELVVLDADLIADCRLKPFQARFPERLLEHGIAEQDMVSTAGGLAKQGLLPVVNSFAAFLASRANEQIYNNACERTKIIYACHYAGLIPAAPGQSHQSLRDISLLGALPNMVILQPGNTEETRQGLQWCIEESHENCALRLIIGPSPRQIVLPGNYRLVLGKGTVLHEGHDAVLFAYGPVMLHEALVAAERLSDRGFSLRVVNMPWLNRVDRAWLRDVIGERKGCYVLEDHSIIGGLGDFLARELLSMEGLLGKRWHIFGLNDYPAWGLPPEVLRHHRLDGESLADQIAKFESDK